MRFDVLDDRRRGVEGRQHLALKRQAGFLCRRTGPGIGMGFHRRMGKFHVPVEFGMIGIVGDRAGVPRRRMVPRRRADGESRRLCPGSHAASLTLAYQAEMGADERELRQWLQERERLLSAPLKFGTAAYLDAADEKSLTAAGEKYFQEC